MEEGSDQGEWAEGITNIDTLLVLVQPIKIKSLGICGTPPVKPAICQAELIKKKTKMTKKKFIVKQI